MMEHIIQLSESAPGFESLQWAAKAVARKDDSREALRCIKVEPSRTVSTDGHRLHTDTVETGLEPGLYTVVKSLVKSLQLEKTDGELSYPDTDSVFPDLEDCEKVTLYQGGESQDAINLALIVRAMPDNAINPRFLADLLPMEYAHVPNNPMKPITFVNGTKRALLMPIRMES